MKNVECFVTILCENWWNIKNSHCFLTKIHSPPLTFSDNQWSERPELTRSKIALLFLPVQWNLEIRALQIFRWKQVFFLIKWLLLGNLRVEAPSHDSGKGCCIDRIDRATMVFELFWTGFGDPVVTMVVCTKKKCAIQVIHGVRNTWNRTEIVKTWSNNAPRSLWSRICSDKDVRVAIRDGRPRF